MTIYATLAKKRALDYVYSLASVLYIFKTLLPASKSKKRMLRIPEKRQKKLFAGEKCSICDREANGIKYNAISCDSCRVFFRRIVLSMEKSNKTQLPCIRVTFD